MARENKPQFGDETVAIIGKRFEDNGDPARAVAFITICSSCAPPNSPVPFLIARSMLSLGIDCCLATVTAVRRRGLPLISPPPRRAAMVISLMSLVKSLPRLASRAAFLCLSSSIWMT